MEAYYGFDLRTRTYWYRIDIMGQEVGGKRFLTREELEKAKAENGMANWRKDTDFIH